MVVFVCVVFFFKAIKSVPEVSPAVFLLVLLKKINNSFIEIHFAYHVIHTIQFLDRFTGSTELRSHHPNQC